VEFEWDERKRETNLAKHRVDFIDAVIMFGGVILEAEDERRDYGERRFRALGVVKGQVLHVVYTLRHSRRRIISARKAGHHEQKAYYAHLRGRGEEDER